MMPGRSPLSPFSRGDVPAMTASEASAFDTRAIDVLGVPQPVLMENAGRSAALVIHHVFRPGRVVGVVGSGNNGGDALVVLRSLSAWGIESVALLVADRPAGDPLLHGWPLRVVADRDLSETDLSSLLDGADVIVDGILGTGARGEPRPRQAAVINRMNGSSTPVVALDVPTGADATTGALLGPTVQAALTISFGAPKTGICFHPARARAGRHVAVEIGFPPIAEVEAQATARLVTPEFARGHLPIRDTAAHKNRVGRLLIVGGGVGMAGAAILAARAAFQAGAGLVQVLAPTSNRDAVQAGIPEAIFISADDGPGLSSAAHDADAIVVGPGLGTSDESGSLLASIVGIGTQPILLDADALNLIAGGSVSLGDIGASRPTLITPHPGEMARLTRDRDGAGYPIERARSLASECSVHVLLKGAPSVVAPPSGPVMIDTQSSSDLAVAGMGDALAGVCGALMAQGLWPDLAGALGLYLSGRAARLAARGAGLMPSDVSNLLPVALTETRPSESDLPFPFVLFDAEPAR